MKQILVEGGFRFFGSAVTQQLRTEGLRPLVGSRRDEADLVVDVECKTSLHDTLRKDDLVIAAVGPYQIHSTTLVEAAIETEVDVIDLSDNLGCVREVYRLKGAIDGSGRRVLTACNTVSAIFATCLRASHIAHPVRITGLLVPATKYTAVKGKAASLFCSVSQPVEVSEGGSLRTRRGWASSRRFCLPPLIGDVKGFLFESADAITLPPRSPSLKQTDYFVSTNVTGLYELFAVTHVAWL